MSKIYLSICFDFSGCEGTAWSSVAREQGTMLKWRCATAHMFLRYCNSNNKNDDDDDSDDDDNDDSDDDDNDNNVNNNNEDR